MEFIYEYLMFAAKVLTVVVSITIPFLLIFIIKKTAPETFNGKIEVKKLNDYIETLQLEIQREILDTPSYKKAVKNIQKRRKTKSQTKLSQKTFILDFDGDMKASGVSQLKEEITAILMVASEEDQILLILESAGGTMHGYGLAASQLQRITDKKIHLTVVVDRVAASGGYLMACVANEIIAAPFSIIGSIGVVGQLPNFNRLLKSNNIEFEQLTAGKHKRTLTIFGENTEEAREKFQSDLDEAHGLFKNFVQGNRPQIELDKISTGEYWQAAKAKELGLIDRLATSDEVILEAINSSEVFKISTKKKRSFLSKFSPKLSSLL